MKRFALAVFLAAAVVACVDRSAPASDGPAKNVDVSGVPSQIRILVAPSRTFYRLENGVARGVTADDAAAFKQWLNQQSASPGFDVTLIETPEDRLVADLIAGKGEIAANIRLTFERDDQVAFAKPLFTAVKEIIVTGPGEKPLVSLEDVGGRTIHVRPGSDHHASLVRLNSQLNGINRPLAKIVQTPGTDEDLLEMANAGRIPATITDDYLFDRWAKTFSALNANRDVAVSQDGVIAWVTRKDTPQLLKTINAFFATHAATPRS